jgi:hypothetical protein
LNYDIKVTQSTFTREGENINKEINQFMDKIKGLENNQRELKNEQEKLKFKYEYEVSKLGIELNMSNDKM